MIYDSTIPMSPEAEARWDEILAFAESVRQEAEAEAAAAKAKKRLWMRWRPHRWQERVDLCG